MAFRQRVHMLLCVLFAALISFACTSTATAVPTLEEMAGAMVMTGFDGKTAPEPVLQAIRSGHLGGVIIYNGKNCRNISSKEQLTALITTLKEAAPDTLLVAVDQEGGIVSRLSPDMGFTPLPRPQVMAETLSPAEIKKLVSASGREMAACGINIDFAPLVDVLRAEKSPGHGDLGRLFSRDAKKVVDCARAFIAGLNTAHVTATLKHFPGLGSASVDSHLGLPDVTETWDKSELLPYRTAAAEGWKALVMVGHIYNRKLDPDYPSSLSKKIIQGILRDELHYSGVIISDDLQMGAVTKQYSVRDRVRLAIQAGTDILLFSSQFGEYTHSLGEEIFQTILGLVHDGTISQERLHQSWKRIQAFKATL